MRRRGVLLLALALPGCTAWQDPRPGPIRAMAPRPNPPAAPARAAAPDPGRRAAWVTRFWEELTPAQRRMVSARMRRDRARREADAAQVQAAWDVMGLPEREALVRGRPAPPDTATAGTPPREQHAETEGAPTPTTR